MSVETSTRIVEKLVFIFRVDYTGVRRRWLRSRWNKMNEVGALYIDTLDSDSYPMCFISLESLFPSVFDNACGVTRNMHQSLFVCAARGKLPPVRESEAEHKGRNGERNRDTH